MSLLGKKWQIRNENKSLNVVAKLLQNRGIDSPEKAEAFFNGKIEHLFDARLLKDLDKAAERLKKAILGKEKIMIFGDYDVDGITATAILHDLLKRTGADAHYTLPNRETDGYGLKAYFIERFKKEGVHLVVTVDCGTANLKEVQLANELGMDVIITDHHSIPAQLPPAFALVNPQQADCPYPNKDICGSSIAYKLACVLAAELLDGKEVTLFKQRQLAHVALGVVGDCMPIVGENRILVREGLKCLISGYSPGISELLKLAGVDPKKITSSTIGFQIAPRINAAGRLDTPEHAFQLLAGNLEKALTLNQLNEKRREVAKQFIDAAVAEVKAMDPLPGIIAVKSDQWRAGLLGLIASELCERFGRPAIAMQIRETEIVASTRSLNDFDITSVLRESANGLFSAFGGHAMAGGFTLPKENLDEFLKRIDRAGKEKVDPAKFIGVLKIDCEVHPDEISFSTVNKLEHLEPFGSENPQPTLLLKNVRISDIKPVGKSAEHLQFPVERGDKKFRAIAFRFGRHLDKIDPEKAQDIVFSLEANEWNGTKRLQLRVIDMKPTEQ